MLSFNTRDESIRAVDRGIVDDGSGNTYSVHFYQILYGLKDLITIPLEMEPQTYHMVFVNKDQRLLSMIEKTLDSMDDVLLQ